VHDVHFENPVKQLGYAMVYHVATLDDELSAEALRTLLVYTMFAQQKNACWPSRKTVAQMRKKDVATITRHNQELERLGYIKRQKRSGTSSITILTDYESSPRLVELARQILQERNNAPTDTPPKRKSALSKSADVRPAKAHKRAPEEEPIEEEPIEENSQAISSLGGFQELEYVDLDAEEKPPPRNSLEKLLQFKFGFRDKRMSKGQARRLLQPVSVGDPDDPGVLKELPGPATLYDSDPLFREYVGRGIEWALGDNFAKAMSNAARRNACIGWIRNYERPRSGWLAWKEGRNETGRRRARGPAESKREADATPRKHDRYGEQIKRWLERKANEPRPKKREPTDWEEHERRIEQYLAETTPAQILGVSKVRPRS